MADGSTVVSCEARSYAGKGLLFPVEPTAGETLLSYLVRCVERNHLQSPVQFLRQAGSIFRYPVISLADYNGRFLRSRCCLERPHTLLPSSGARSPWTNSGVVGWAVYSCGPTSLIRRVDGSGLDWPSRTETKPSGCSGISTSARSAGTS